MTDDMDRDEEEQLAAEYALGLLTPAEAAAFEDAMALDGGLRRSYAFWVEHFTTLTDDVAEVAPPDDMLDRILARVPDEEQAAPAAAPRRSWLERLGLFPAAAAGLLAALLLLVFIDFTPQQAFNPQLAADMVTEDDAIFIHAGYDPETFEFKVIRRAGAPAEGRDFELWLIPAGSDTPISLGVLPEEEETGFTLPEEIRPLLEGGTLAVSDEPAGGSPTGTPTTVLAASPVTDV